MLDLVIRGGTVYDGLGGEPRAADVGIRRGSIVAVGALGPCPGVAALDAAGAAVSPGFIDLHSHADLALLRDPEHRPKVLQGVTTEVIGNCGFSPAPSHPDTAGLLRTYLGPTLGDAGADWTWRTAGEYLHLLEARRPSVNVAALVGHGALRIRAMGFARRAPVPAELRGMAASLEEALAAGCAGLSIGLIYAPACYAEDDEIEALCRVVARSGGYLAVHMRNESDRMAAAVGENLALARRTGVRLQLSHLKASGQANWPQLLPALHAIEAARAEGVSVSCDQYPYVAGSTTITVLLPQWALDGGVDAMLARLRDPAIRDHIRRDFEAGIPGWDCLVRANGWDNILVSWAADGGQAFEGRTLADIARAAGGDPAEALFDLILRLRGQASIVVFQQSEDNVEAAMRRPYVAIGSDGLHAGVRAHPRLYGTFPRVLGRYVRERGTLSLAEAVRKMTSLPADVLGRADRGRLAEGCAADVTVFEPGSVADTGTFAEPDGPPRGIRHVVVNGVPVVQDGSHTGARPGAILRRG